MIVEKRAMQDMLYVAIRNYLVQFFFLGDSMGFERGVNSPSLGSSDSVSFDVWNEDESEPELNELQHVNVGYVPLGSELVESVGDDDDEDDIDGVGGDRGNVEQAASVNETHSEGEHHSMDVISEVDKFPADQSREQVPSVEDSAVDSTIDCLLPDSLVDRLLRSHLETTDLQVGGACADASIYTQSLSDSTRAHLWNTACSTPDSIILTQAKTDEIKNRMANFMLPQMVVPPWALQIPEEVWKRKLLEKVSTSGRSH
ncbi:hypothetical protein FGIG_06371 [Fasciola gigantica]|uniref:Male-enhanced antigen 1 n=1 Tax=Fasciola gigantica TaxID=46835 RepID=A0A504XRE8_FASGI|nr:hypothetical protein FGIG_06371 [Fasciola gigantica]